MKINSFTPNRTLIFFFFLWMIISPTLTSQTVIVQPPQGYISGNTSPRLKVFFKPTDSVIVSWNKSFPASKAKLKIGSTTGNYNLSSLPVGGTRMAFIPKTNPPNLSVGRYRALLTSSTKNTLSEIKTDYTANPTTIDYSNEIEFIIESPNAPYAEAPRGGIKNSTPTFQWNSIPGVRAYWLIVSSTPFTVVTKPNGDVSVEGANVLWNYLTTGTSVQYGSINPSSPFTVQAPPLIPGNEYHYTVLNVYDEYDITYSSGVFGGVVSFTYDATASIQPPTLIAPENNAVFYAEKNINLQWNSVPDANGYTVFLFQRVSSFAGNEQQIDIPIWYSSTTNTSIQLPARTMLTKGKYIWFVVPRDNSGSGNKSAINIFDYIIDLGKFRVQAKSSVDSSSIIGFKVYANSLSGGVSPPNPFIVTNSTSYSDSLVLGTYEFRGEKSGFYDSTYVTTINKNSTSDFTIFMRPYPAKLSGRVVDEKGALLNSALVRLRNLLNGNIQTVTTLVDGSFNVALPKGTYSLQVSKAGYLASSPTTITLDVDQMIISAAIVIHSDNASITGNIINDESQPVQLVNVIAKQGAVTQQTSSDNSGNYYLNLSSGEWTLEIKKDGFIPPYPKIYTLNTGDNLQNQNFTVIPRANQVVGYVYKVTKTATGETGTTPFANVTVTATPNSGATRTAVTNSAGQYTFSLRTGSWIISTATYGYTSSKNIQLNLGVAETVSGINLNLIPNACTISGTAINPTGSGIGNVSILSSSGASTITIANGTYQLSVPASTVTISAQKAGYTKPNSITVSLSPGQNLSGIDFQLAENAGIISGKVTSFQAPVPNASIKVVSANQSFVKPTDEFGNYVFNLQPGTWNISATKTGFVSSNPLTISVGPGQQSVNNDFSLIKNMAKIEGLIADASAPLQNAQITITSIDDPTKKINTVSNVGGLYSAAVEAGKAYKIDAKLVGYSSKNQQTAVLSTSSTSTNNFTLSANPSSVSGSVLSNMQLPLAEAEIIIYNNTNGSAIDTIFSDLNGNYYIGLPSGNEKLVGRLDGYLGDSIDVNLSLGQNLTNVNFSLDENFALVNGIVKDKSNKPIDGATVNLTGTNGGATVLSNSDGSFIITKLIGGLYNVTISKKGFGDTLLTSFSISDGQTKNISVALLPLDGKIKGVVKNSSSQPIAQATVYGVNTNNQSFTAATSSDGSYEFPAVAFGQYTVSVVKTQYTSPSTNLVNITNLSSTVTANFNDLILNNATLSGKVIDDMSGLPISNVSLNLSGILGSGSAITNTSGDYTITALAPGAYTVKTVKAGYSLKDSALTVSGTTSLNLFMIKNKSNIVGTVKNQKGTALSFAVPVVAVSNNGNIYSTNSNLSGAFTFEGVESNANFNLYTDIFKQGVENDTASVTVPLNTTQVDAGVIVVTENYSVIKGNAGVGNVNLKFNSALKSYSVLSSADGSFELGYLPDAAYTVKPEKSGYTFSPSTQNVSPGFKDTAKVTFTATSNIGTLKVIAKDQSSVNLEQVTISLVSSDTTVISNGITASTGEFTFTNVPAGKTYILRVSKNDYTPSPDQLSKSLALNENAVVNFVLTKNSAKVTGKTVQVVSTTTSPLANTNVKLLYPATGQSISAVSDGSGNYSFTNVPAGNVKVLAIKAGYLSDTLSFSLQAGQTKSNQDVKLTPSTVTVNGKVLYAGSGLSKVALSATSNSSFDAITDQNGNFSFKNLPIKVGATDTTFYEIKITQTGLPALNKIVLIPSNQLGKTVTLPSFIVPSGKITLRATDGINPLSGVQIDFTKPDGQTVSTITTISGLYESENKLSKGVYRLSATKDNYLVQDETSLRIELASDTIKISKDLALPYKHIPLTSILADKESVIKVNFTKTNANVTGKLFYKLASADVYTFVALTKKDSTYEQKIPALRTLEDIQYYVELTDTTQKTIYSSESISLKPSASGILSSASLSPEIDNSI
ncbi:MAG: carboxypeptidase-like regulatory domain-containing protein, partial [Ignavibacteria bacterium]|nr:carboxypeptidase-like regulatory domain-containing protein [Ignavibacteria bacterium]